MNGNNESYHHCQLSSQPAAHGVVVCDSNRWKKEADRAEGKFAYWIDLCKLLARLYPLGLTDWRFLKIFCAANTSAFVMHCMEGTMLSGGLT